MPRTMLIVNPTAGRGFAAKSLPEIEETLKSHHIEYDLFLTERPWHAADLAEEGAKKGYDSVVVASGDGTANEVLNGLMRAKAKGYDKTAMGQIAVGTGNDFAFGFHIPGGVSEGCRILAENYRRRMDVGLLKGGDYPEGRYFGNGVGIGFDAATGFVAAKIRWTRGLLLYLIAAIETIFIYYKPAAVHLTYDDQEMDIHPLMISIMNGRRMGGGFMMTPTSSIDDGAFSLCIVRNVPQIAMFGLIAKFMKATHVDDANVTMVQAKKITARALKGTLPVHADSVTICEEGKEIMVELIPGGLEIITRLS